MTLPLRGTIEVPGDKSISHRAFILNALGTGRCRVRGASAAGDVTASRSLVSALGVDLQPEGDGWVLSGVGLSEPDDVLDCGNSGTTMRLGAALCTHQPGIAVLTGDDSLRGRPMRRIIEPLGLLGHRVLGTHDDTRAPLVVRRGVPVRADITLSVASAQVKSAALIAGMAAGVTVREPRQSRDHTERMLGRMEAPITVGRDGITLEPGPWRRVDVDVPGDLSAAAFWMVAASIVPGSEILLPRLGLNPTRTGVIDALLAMGADIQIEVRDSGHEPVGDVLVRHAPLRGTEISGELALRALDELPVLGVAAAFANGETRITDASELRNKESDRISRVVEGLRALGGQADPRPDGFVVGGGGLDGGGRIDTSGDHRIAMAFAVASLAARQSVELSNPGVVASSYPGFFEELTRVQAG